MAERDGSGTEGGARAGAGGAGVDAAARTLVAAGGAGFLGRHLVAAAVRRGWTVAVPTRRPAALDAFAALLAPEPGALHVVALDGEDPYPGAVARLREVVPDASAVVASVGGWSIGAALIDIGAGAWRRALDDHLTAHLRAMQAYVPLVADAPDPVYVTTNGAAAEVPMVGSGPVCVTGAAQRMLLDVMRVEPVGRRVRFHEVTVTAAVAGDDRNLDPVGEVTPDAVAAAVLAVVADPASAAHVRVGPVGA